MLPRQRVRRRKSLVLRRLLLVTPFIVALAVVEQGFRLNRLGSLDGDLALRSATITAGGNATDSEERMNTSSQNLLALPVHLRSETPNNSEQDENETATGHDVHGRSKNSVNLHNGTASASLPLPSSTATFHKTATSVESLVQLPSTDGLLNKDPKTGDGLKLKEAIIANKSKSIE